MSWRNVGYEWAAVGLLLGVLLALHYFKPEWTSPVEVVFPREQASAYHAIDGDSFKMGGTEIRLNGIDAPEYRQTCTGSGNLQYPCGKLARDALSKLIRTKTIVCSMIQRDRYGREVSTCRDGTLEINREMVKLGWAVAYRKYSQKYVAVENEAKAAKRGVWAWDFEQPSHYRERHRTVQGDVVGNVFKDD